MIGTQVIRAQYQSHIGRVAYYEGSVTTIEKVHKNGNVIIAGRQYRPSIDKETFNAVSKAVGYNRAFYVVYNDKVKARMQENAAHFDRQYRLRAVQEKVANARDITEEALKKIEEALGL